MSFRDVRMRGFEKRARLDAVLDAVDHVIQPCADRIYINQGQRFEALCVPGQSAAQRAVVRLVHALQPNGAQEDRDNGSMGN